MGAKFDPLLGALRTTDSGGSSGTWTVLDTTTVSSAAASVTTGTFAGKKFLQVWVYIPALSGTGTVWWFNGDTATNYNSQRSTNSGAASTNSSEAFIRINTGNSSADGVITQVVHISNPGDNYKTGIGQTVYYNATDNLLMGDQRFVWKNTTNQITSITIQGNTLANVNLPIGMEILTLGRD